MFVFHSVSLYYLLATLVISEYIQTTFQMDADAINHFHTYVRQISSIGFQNIKAVDVVKTTSDEFSVKDLAST